jgi:hypothetical protein
VMPVDLCRLALQFDLEPFSNPYTDSWILHSSPEQNVNMVFAGIDIETPEILHADRLQGKYAVVDAVGARLQGPVSRRSLCLFTKACPG